MDRPQSKTAEKDLELALRSFENEFLVFGSRAIRDSNVRRRYQELVEQTAREIHAFAVRTGRFSDAARMAVQLRNEIMDTLRLASSDISQAVAFSLKSEGRKLDYLLNKTSLKVHQQVFSKLTDPAAQRRVFLEVIESSGRANTVITKYASLLGKAGKGFVVASLGIALYEVATAEDKSLEVAKQSLSIGLGSALSIAGGWAGAFCGPGAVVCIPMGVFVGGALGAVATEYVF